MKIFEIEKQHLRVKVKLAKKFCTSIADTLVTLRLHLKIRRSN